MFYKLLFISLLSISSIGRAQDSNRVWMNMSNPSNFTSTEIMYERDLGLNKLNKKSFVGLGVSSKTLKQSEEQSLQRQAGTFYLGANVMDGFMHRFGLGYEGGDGEETGFIVNRLGYISRQDCGLACDFSFGVDWRVNFRKTELQKVPTKESEVYPYFGFALNF